MFSLLKFHSTASSSSQSMSSPQNPVILKEQLWRFRQSASARIAPFVRSLRCRLINLNFTFEAFR